MLQAKTELAAEECETNNGFLFITMRKLSRQYKALRWKI